MSRSKRSSLKPNLAFWANGEKRTEYFTNVQVQYFSVFGQYFSMFFSILQCFPVIFSFFLQFYMELVLIELIICHLPLSFPIRETSKQKRTEYFTNVYVKYSSAFVQFFSFFFSILSFFLQSLTRNFFLTDWIICHLPLSFPILKRHQSRSVKNISGMCKYSIFQYLFSIFHFFLSVFYNVFHSFSIADSAQTEYCSTFHFPCVRAFVTGVTSHISHIYKGINATLIIRDPSTPIYSESKSSWLSF